MDYKVPLGRKVHEVRSASPDLRGREVTRVPQGCPVSPLPDPQVLQDPRDHRVSPDKRETRETQDQTEELSVATKVCQLYTEDACLPYFDRASVTANGYW